MKNQPRPSKTILTRIPDKIERFYLFCSGVELSLLPPEEKETYVTLGRIVVFNTTIAGLTGCFTISSIAGIPFFSVIGIAGGVLWARGIFAIDRPLMRMPKEETAPWGLKVARVLPRLGLAALLSMTVAIPVETWIFKDSAKTVQIEKLRQESGNISARKNAEDKKRHRLDPTTGQTFIDRQVVERVNAYDKQIEEIDGRIKAIEQNATGLREMAFTEQVRINWETALSNPADGLLHFFVIALFFGIEILPVIYKMLLMPYDTYDNAFNVWRTSRKKADNETIPAREQKRALEEITIISRVSGDTERLEKMAQNIKDIRDEAYEHSAIKHYETQANKDFPVTADTSSPRQDFNKAVNHLSSVLSGVFTANKPSRRTVSPPSPEQTSPAQGNTDTVANGQKKSPQPLRSQDVAPTVSVNHANGHDPSVQKVAEPSNWEDFLNNIPEDFPN
jgi:hypothetical protein